MDSAVFQKYNSLLGQLGQAGMSAAFPNDFEYYYTALELTDSNDNTLIYLGFPINPSAIQKNEIKRVNIKKTASGITVISNDSMMPAELTLKGNFGRNFKILFSNKSVEGRAWGLIGKKSKLKTKFPEFDAQIKTGFGCTKILQSIIDNSNSLDASGLPNRLYFYNLALGESYLVTSNQNGLTLSQSEDQNRIWGYNLPLTILAKIEDLQTKKDKTSNALLLSSSLIQSGINIVANDVKDFVFKYSNSTFDSNQDLKSFNKKIKFKLDDYLNDFVDFIENKFDEFVKYYKGDVKSLSKDSVNSFVSLKSKSSKVDELIEGISNNFTTLDGWKLLEVVEGISSSLLSIENLGKWMRSSSNNNVVNLDYIQNQGQSLESISKVSGYNTYEDSWMNLSLDNKIREEDYTSKGGAPLKLTFSNNVDFNISNIVGSLYGINIYGKDIDKTFSLDSGDLSTLDFNDCVDQALNIILSTVQGGIPEFPEDGIPEDLIGSNINSLQYPAIIRSLSKMLQKDDRFDSLELIRINQVDDNLLMNVNVTTKLNQSKTKDVAL